MRRLNRVWIARRAIDLVMLVLLIAGVLKAADIAAFAEDLQTWTLLPKWMPLVLAPVVPCAEIAIAFAWFTGMWRRAAVIGAGAMLVVFTAVYGAHLVFAEPPDCGCMGLLRAFKDATDQAVFTLTRNSVLFLLLAGGGAVLWARGPGAWGGARGAGGAAGIASGEADPPTAEHA